MNRVTDVSYQGGVTEAFTYDAAGNRISHTNTDGDTIGYTVDATGQLVSDTTGTTYSYDQAGNLLATSAGDAYVYDDYGRTIEATGNGITQTFGYDATDVRVTVDGISQLWDRSGGLPTLISTGVGDNYVHTNTGIARDGDDWLLADAVGSVRATVDNTVASADCRAPRYCAVVADSIGRRIGSIESGLEELSLEDHRHILVLSDELLACTSLAQLSSIAVNGVGSLIESSSVAWTELDVSSYVRAERSVVAVDSDQVLDFDELRKTFDRHATEHPVINTVLETGSTLPIAISDCLSEEEFTALDLYQDFYAGLGIVDQLSVGRVIGDVVVGCSVNRDRRGFDARERALLNPLGHVIFSTYRMLSDAQDTHDADRLLTVIGDPSFLRRATSLGLTEREAEVLAHIASGKSNKQIAHACELSPGTVRKHTENIYRSLNVNNRVTATLVALDRLR